MTSRREGKAADDYKALNDPSPDSGSTNSASYTGGSHEGPAHGQKIETPFQDPEQMKYSSYEQIVQRYSDEDDLPDEASAWRVEDDDISYW